MLLMGDEVRRTQHGNNNAYCQDNELSWFDWDDTVRAADLLRFTRGLIGLRRAYGIFADERFWGELDATRLIWHGVRIHEPDWSDSSHCLACELFADQVGEQIYFIFNAYWDALHCELPAPAHGAWRRVIDTSLAPPEDYCEPALAPPIGQNGYHVGPRSVVVLVALP
jgi:glycogen operon protein